MALENAPSLQPFGKSPPLVGSLPPAQSEEPDGMLSLIVERFWPGENRKFHWKPPMVGDSYQIECSSRVSNSTRLSPPVLPMITRMSPICPANGLKPPVEFAYGVVVLPILMAPNSGEAKPM